MLPKLESALHIRIADQYAIHQDNDTRRTTELMWFIAQCTDSPSSNLVTHLKLDRIVVALGPKGFVGIVDIGLVLVTANDRLHFTPNLHQVLGVPENDFQQGLLQSRKMVFLQQR